MPFLKRLLALLLLVISANIRADVVWDSRTGWRVEGASAIAGLATGDQQKVLDLMNRARQAEETRHYRTALKLYRIVTKKHGNSIYAPEANFRIGTILYYKRKYVKAFDAYQAVISKYPNTERFQEIIAQEYQIGTDLVKGKRKRFWFGIPGFRDRTKGIEILETVVLNAPYTDYAPMALMRIAKAHQRLDEPEEAAYALDRIVNTYPKTLIASDAYLQLGDVNASLSTGPYYDQSYTNEAITYYEDFLILFPDDPSSARAEAGRNRVRTTLAESKMILGDYYFKHRHNNRAARILLNEAITAHPDSEIARKAKQRLAQIDAIESGATPGAGEGGKKRHFLNFPVYTEKASF